MYFTERQLVVLIYNLSAGRRNGFLTHIELQDVAQHIHGHVIDTRAHGHHTQVGGLGNQSRNQRFVKVLRPGVVLLYRDKMPGEIGFPVHLHQQLFNANGGHTGIDDLLEFLHGLRDFCLVIALQLEIAILDVGKGIQAEAPARFTHTLVELQNQLCFHLVLERLLEVLVGGFAGIFPTVLVQHQIPERNVLFALGYKQVA